VDAGKFGALESGVEFVDRPTQSAFALPAGTAQRPFGVAHHGGGVSHSVYGDPGELAGDAAHRGLRLVALLLAA
jgi:hypothetical protein